MFGVIFIDAKGPATLGVSFEDKGACRRAWKMCNAGAAIIDAAGEVVDEKSGTSDAALRKLKLYAAHLKRQGRLPQSSEGEQPSRGRPKVERVELEVEDEMEEGEEVDPDDGDDDGDDEAPEAFTRVEGVEQVQAMVARDDARAAEREERWSAPAARPAPAEELRDVNWGAPVGPECFRGEDYPADGPQPIVPAPAPLAPELKIGHLVTFPAGGVFGGGCAVVQELAGVGGNVVEFFVHGRTFSVARDSITRDADGWTCRVAFPDPPPARPAEVTPAGAPVTGAVVVGDDTERLAPPAAPVTCATKDCDHAPGIDRKNVRPAWRPFCGPCRVIVRQRGRSFPGGESAVMLHLRAGTLPAVDPQRAAYSSRGGKASRSAVERRPVAPKPAPAPKPRRDPSPARTLAAGLATARAHAEVVGRLGGLDAARGLAELVEQHGGAAAVREALDAVAELGQVAA